MCVHVGANLQVCTSMGGLGQPPLQRHQPSGVPGLPHPGRRSGDRLAPGRAIGLPRDMPLVRLLITSILARRTWRGSSYLSTMQEMVTIVDGEMPWREHVWTE